MMEALLFKASGIAGILGQNLVQDRIGFLVLFLFDQIIRIQQRFADVKFFAVGLLAFCANAAPAPHRARATTMAITLTHVRFIFSLP